MPVKLLKDWPSDKFYKVYTLLHFTHPFISLDISRQNINAFSHLYPLKASRFALPLKLPVTAMIDVSLSLNIVQIFLLFCSSCFVSTVFHHFSCVTCSPVSLLPSFIVAVSYLRLYLSPWPRRAV